MRHGATVHKAISSIHTEYKTCIHAYMDLNFSIPLTVCVMIKWGSAFATALLLGSRCHR